MGKNKNRKRIVPRSRRRNFFAKMTYVIAILMVGSYLTVAIGNKTDAAHHPKPAAQPVKLPKPKSLFSH